MLCSHVKESALLRLRNKVIWLCVTLVCVYYFNMTLHGHLEIRNFSSHVEEYFQMGLFAFQHFKEIKFANFAEFCPMALLRVNGLIGLTCA